MKRLTTTKLTFYLSAFAKSLAPGLYLRHDLRKILAAHTSQERDYLAWRLNYYHPVDYSFAPSTAARCRATFVRSGLNSSYYFDLLEFLRYFDDALYFDYRFGDNTINPDSPTLVKSRPILAGGQHGILFKLNKVRHFKFVDSDIAYLCKADGAVFRGACGRPHRRRFVENFYRHPGMDIGDTKPEHRGLPGWKPYMSIRDQLRHKFIVSIEGNDVATNLKWIMSSNSLCLMRRPRYETWFMEGTLKPDIHYGLLSDDFSDLPEKIDYFLSRPDHAREIVHNANRYVEQFRADQRERLLCLLVLERYFSLSRQLPEGSPLLAAVSGDLAAS